MIITYTLKVRYVLVALCAFTMLFTSFAYAENSDDMPVGCTEEAKICPDGTSVSRGGKNCEFAPCPGEQRADKARNIFNRLGVNREETKTRRPEVREEFQEKKAELKEALKVADTPEERKAILEEAKSQFTELKNKIKTYASVHLQQILKRISTMAERLETLQGRIQSRLDKLTQDGADTTEAQEYVDIAKTAVQASVDKGQAVKATVEEAVNSETPSEYRRVVREAMSVAIEATREAKKALQDAVNILRGLATN